MHTGRARKGFPTVLPLSLIHILPIARAFLDILGTYLFFFAMSSPDANAHGPNEFIRIEEFERLRKGLRVFWAKYASSFEN